jgi:RimJ/RimL family protein N-acetyltransferase
MFPVQIRTDRLRLTRLTRDVLPPLEAYRHFARSDTVEEETRFVSWDPHETPKESEEFVAQCERAWEAGEGAVYAVFPRQGERGTGEFAGTAGMHFEWDRDVAELGVWLRKPFWGRGYSAERAAALIDVAFGDLDVSLIRVAVDPENEQSVRAVEKYVERAGGRCEGTFRNAEVDVDGDPMTVDRYSVSRSEWLDSSGEDRVAEVTWP